MRQLFLLLILVLPGVVCGQTTKAQLRTQLIGKSLFLRALCREDKLQFDADGRPVGSCTAQSFAVSLAEIDSVRLKSNELMLDGRREGITFIWAKDKSDDSMQRVVLRVRSGFAGTKDEELHIQVHLPPSGDAEKTLAAIFAGDLADLVPTLPEYWQSYGKTHFSHTVTDGPEVKALPVLAGVNRVGGGVTAPVVLKAPEPKFTPEARNVKMSGKVLVYLRVDKSGMPYQVRVLRPTGLGLDENAVAAVKDYRFKPAMKGGEPVAVEMNVEVNFESRLGDGAKARAKTKYRGPSLRSG